jgi:hypothetical protein
VAPPKAIPARPPTFQLRMRLADAKGSAALFAKRDYQIWWGGKLVQEGQTEDDAVIEADLDDAYDSGYLDLGDKDQSAKFVARITIPIEIVAPPPPPPKPIQHGKAPSKKPKDRSKPQREWTDEADPPPPEPIFLRNYEDQDAVRLYEAQKKAWDDWEKRREQRQREAKEQQRRDELFREQQAGEEKLRRDFKGHGDPVKPHDKAPPPMSAAQKKEIDDNLQRAREEMHAVKVTLYELAYRLRNLGWLPDSDSLSFPIRDIAKTILLHAMRRYAYKNSLPLPEESDLDEIGSATVKKLYDAVKKEHDG